MSLVDVNKILVLVLIEWCGIFRCIFYSVIVSPVTIIIDVSEMDDVHEFGA